MFETQVQTQPGAISLKFGESSLTYAQLDVSAHRVAAELKRCGLQSEEPAAVFLPASPEFIIAVLAVLKAGGCYLPVAVETPVKRLEYLLSDSRSRFALSQGPALERLRGWPGRVLDLAPLVRAHDHQTAGHAGAPCQPGHRAYVIYTSGSTGQPKGVEIEHHSLVNLVDYYHRRWNLTAGDRASMLAHIAFDVSEADLWPVLCAGGSVVIPPKDLFQDPDALIAWLDAEAVTFSFVPTGLAEILFSRRWRPRMKLRVLVTGGDRLRVRPPKDLPFAVINGYGPTEGTVFSTFSVVTPEDGKGEPPPIGRPVDNVTAHVLDEQLQPVPPGEPGELYLGGAQVARGYFGRPELTRERFVADPFAGKPDARMYRTGDWVKWRPDGELDFLGRRDDQIQIRGSRVELGEIEARLFAHAAVRQVCCVPLFNEGMPTGVVAHVVPSARGHNPAAELRTYLNAHLPEYMVPSEFVIHERLPLTPQGKADRAAMMANARENPAPCPALPAEDGLEKALWNLWHSLLSAARQSAPEATFAQLGGDSLSAIKLMLGVEEIVGQRLELSSFLLQPTFGGLCAAVKARLARSAFEPVLTIRKQGTRPPLFCLHGHNGDIDIYFHLAEALGGDQPVYGIRSPALENLSRLPRSMEEAAAAVVGSIRKLRPHGAPALAGFSWAGLLAFEVARQWQQTDGAACFVALVGADAPNRPANWLLRLTHFGRFCPAWIWHWLSDGGNRAQRLAQMVRGAKWSPAAAPPAPAWAASPISRHLIGLMETYHPRPQADLVLDLFRERDCYQPRAHPLHAWHTAYRPDSGWNLWTQKANRVHWLAGDHDTIVKPPFVATLAQAIRQAMDRNSRLQRIDSAVFS